MMYEIYRPPSSSSYQLSNIHNVKNVDQNIVDDQQKTREYINSLECEILALCHKQVFDGVEIPCCPQHNRPPPSDNNSTSGPSLSSHPITEPADSQPLENMHTPTMENTAPIAIPPTLLPIHLLPTSKKLIINLLRTRTLLRSPSQLKRNKSHIVLKPPSMILKLQTMSTPMP
jgi:hypothetical protein